MQNFTYHTPTKLIFGKGVVSQLPEVMKPFGKKILLAYGGGSIKKIGLYAKVKELLQDFELIELPGIQPNPKYDPSVLDGVRLCKEHQVDVICREGIHQKYAVMDDSIVWYGSVNLLSFGASQESIMRLVSGSIARALLAEK